MKKSNPLLDKLVDVDFTLFSSMKLDEITCWEQLEMQSAISGIEIDTQLIKFLTIMAFYKENILDVLKSGIVDGHVLCHFNNNITAIETIYRLLDSSTLNGDEVYMSIQKYLEVSQDLNTQYFFIDDDLECIELNRWKETLFLAIDKIDTLGLIRFYDKWKRILHQTDMPFVRFLHNLTIQKAHKSNEFQPFLIALEAEMKKQQNKTMFLN